MAETSTKDRYRNSVRLIFTAVFAIVGLWFAYKILSIVFLFFLAIVLTLVLNAPTMWLVSKKVPRTLAALIVFFAMLLFLVLIGWLVIPRILEQLNQVINDIPTYYASLKQEASDRLDKFPSLQERLMDKKGLEEGLPSIDNLVTSIGKFSMNLISGIFLAIMFLSVVIYMLINPAPLVETYLLFFSSKKRPKAAKALARSSKMVVGWMYSNLIVGTMEAVLTFFFLSFMGVPGVWVWAGLALFAEMVPKLGLYIMAIPPTLIALAISPMTALWVLIFYLALNEIMGDFVTPRIRSSTMNLHPVSSLFVMLIMAYAFGLLGALISTPLTAFVKAYYEEFYLAKVSKDNLKEQVQVVLERKV